MALEQLLAAGSSGRPLQGSAPRGLLGADLFEEVAKHQVRATPRVEHLTHEPGTVLLASQRWPIPVGFAVSFRH